ncbi:MAG: YbhB/YbcL family Raf kinase inhibitor-like protein [Wenzhouxiangellaceae bacterium]
MKLRSEDIVNGSLIDPQFAFARVHRDQHMELSDNLNPQLSWSELPAAAKSLVLICVDHDAPADASHVNEEYHSLEYGMPRVSFYHWVMIDLPATAGSIARGSCSAGVSKGGKQPPLAGPAGSRQGVNDYTQFLAGSDMAGTYYGYDGPCPPWNDERMHEYYFDLYALDVASLPLADGFDGRAVQQAMQGHVLDRASLVGSYSLNPKVLHQAR